MAARDALACSCGGGDLGFLASGQIEVPLNACGLIWVGILRESTGLIHLPPNASFIVERWYGAAWVDAPFQMTLFRDAGETRHTAFDVVIVGPVENPKPSYRYRYTYLGRPGQTLLGAKRQQVEVVISADNFVGSPAALRYESRVHVGKLSLATLSGDCARELSATWLDIEDILPPEWSKWRDSFYFATYIDMSTWRPQVHLCCWVAPGRSWMGPDKERLYRVLDSGPAATNLLQPGLESEFGSVTVSAWLPGTDQQYVVPVRYSFRGKK